jgi:hypothetical protein
VKNVAYVTAPPGSQAHHTARHRGDANKHCKSRGAAPGGTTDVVGTGGKVTAAIMGTTWPRMRPPSHHACPQCAGEGKETNDIVHIVLNMHACRAGAGRGLPKGARGHGVQTATSPQRPSRLGGVSRGCIFPCPMPTPGLGSPLSQRPSPMSISCALSVGPGMAPGP